MMRDWKKTCESIEEAHHRWNDLILEDEFGIKEEDWNGVIEQTVAHVRGWTDQTIAERVSRMIDLLLPPLQTLWQGKTSELPFRWLPSPALPGATVADHSLTASAIAYCLGYDNDFRTDVETLNQLRLSALTATWKNDGLGDVYDVVWSGFSPIEPKVDGDDIREHIVYLARTAASKQIDINSAEQFKTHPLKQNYPDLKQEIGLVLGGATKIKSYFLESARLPEIRGSSALLDRINLEDIPALFGREISDDPQRLDSIREGFWERTRHLLSAPECIIYAAGGNTLAFTPASIVHKVSDEIERIYTQETLVANSVAVGDTFDLLELQYGLNPTQFWVEEFRGACKNSETLQFMTDYYDGGKDEDFLQRKCFGELTTKLAQAQFYRREGNPTLDRITQRDLPTHVEIDPYQQRCTSCERRPVVINEPRALCEACTRKYVAGRVSKRKIDSNALDHYLKVLGGWRPSGRDLQEEWGLTNWSSLFENYLEATEKVDCYVDTIEHLKQIDGPKDLEDISKASDPPGFIAFIYADGNNMGGYLENVQTPAQYRQFSERAFVATQKAAFEALAEHLGPTDQNLHPFEIVSIGGDDMLLIVPGSKAFEVVHSIGRNFDREFNSHSKLRETEEDNLRRSQRYTPNEWGAEQEMQPAISLSLGFVIANEHTPIGFLEHLASSLLRSAKSRAKTLKKPEVGYLGGTVDFLVLKSLSMITSELGDFRKKFYKTDKENVLTMRPLTLHELHGFIQTVQRFKESNFPRSQLYQLRQSLGLGRHTSTLDYLYFRTRLREGRGKLLQQELESNWQSGADTRSSLGPWYPILQRQGTGKKCYETLLLDLIEAYDFISESNDDSEERCSDKFIS